MRIPGPTRIQHDSVNAHRLLHSIIAVLVVAAASSSGTLAASAEDVSAFDLEGVLTEFVWDAQGGAVALMLRDGEMTTSSIGDRSATGDPLSIDTPFRVLSISKVGYRLLRAQRPHRWGQLGDGDRPDHGDLFVVLTNTPRDAKALAVAVDILAEWAAGGR